MQQLTLFHIVILIGLTQALFLGFVLSCRPHKRHGEPWLIALLVLLAIEMAYQVYYEAGFYHAVPWLIGHDSATFLLYGPLLWFFMRRMAQEQLPRRSLMGLHFLPAVLFQWNAFAYFMLNPENIDFIAKLDQFRHSDAPTTWDAAQFVQEVLIGAYLIACWRVWQRYCEKVEAERAHWQRTGLDWMRQVLQVFSLLWLLVLVRDQLLIWWAWDKAIDHLISVALPLTIFYLAYRLWQQEPIPLVLVSTEPAPTAPLAPVPPAPIPPAPIPLAEASIAEVPLAQAAQPQQALPEPQSLPESSTSPSSAPPTEHEVTRKYAKSALDEASATSIFDALETLMRDGEPWCDPELDLTGLANRLALSPHYLSQAINSRANCNFYDYVNRYRVLAVQRALAQTDAGSILDLAFAAGFNSKSAFYTAFKRHAGLTPRAYQQQIRP